MLSIVVGSMYSGKTSMLLARCERLALGGKTVALFKPDVDTRATGIRTHSGLSMPCLVLPAAVQEIDVGPASAEVLGFDEVQFFGIGLCFVVKEQLRAGKTVIAAGLLRDADGSAFGTTHALLAMADEIVSLFAVCETCGADRAAHTQRREGHGPKIQVGGKETYRAVCRRCLMKREGQPIEIIKGDS